MKHRGGKFSTLILISALFCVVSRAELALIDTSTEEQKARENFINQFIQFTQDKNVMGKGSDPTGKVVSGGAKSKFNGDDGLPFQSDLTYHDFSFNTNDEQAAKANPDDPKAKSRQLYSFISEHGGIPDGGGSSALERAMYEQHVKYSKQDEDPEQQKKQDEEEGVRYRSIFRVDTRDVFKKETANNTAGGATAGGEKKPEEEPEKVERTFLRPDVKQAAEKVGSDSFLTVEQAAKDDGFKDDPKTMGNITLYYEAAARLSQAMWDTTLANLTQRRTNRTIRGVGLRPTLSEDMPNCQAWAQAAGQQLQQIQNPDERQRQEQEIQKMVQQCQQMAAVKWSAIDPQFEEPEEQNNGGGGAGANQNQPQQAQIKEKGPDREDDKARDLRNQLAGMDKVGIDSKELPTNWQYGEEEARNPITVGTDENGNPVTENWTAKEQLEDYNQELDRTAKAFQDIKKVAPDIQFDEKELLARKIEPGTTNILEINKVPEQMLEELGAEGRGAPTAAQDYNELSQQLSQSAPKQ